jgi:hypothetical protein
MGWGYQQSSYGYRVRSFFLQSPAAPKIAAR